MSVQKSCQLLPDFTFTEWPDLTCERNPLPKFHTSTSNLLATFTQDTIPLLLGSLSRILGLYCGANDVLLAHKTGLRGKYSLVRVSCSTEQTWQEVATHVASQLHTGPEQCFHVSELRQALGLHEKQFPCLAALILDGNDAASASEFPVTIFYDVPTNSLSLSSSSTFIHPSMSDQLLAQVTLLLSHALDHPTSTWAILPQLPSNLSSIYSRASDEGISKIYTHLPHVEFATDYLRGRALSSPHAVAVRWFPQLLDDDPFSSSESTTYSELDQTASRIARWLIRQGLQPESRVAVCLTRNLFFHAALMGIMRAGGCYVPIDSELPAERKAYIVRDSNAAVVLTTAELSSGGLFGSTAIYVDDVTIQSAIEEEDCSAFNAAAVDGLSYMLYTSGTTGNPKGCLLTHKGLSQAILALSSPAADVRMDDLREGRYLAVASIAFDVHLAETFVPIALGMPLFSAPRSDLLEDLPYNVNRLGITHLGLVPSLIEATLNATGDDDGVTNLRYIASGGEKMSDSILDRWANHPQVILANFYGPSEVTIGCCARYMDSKTSRANIGRPLANVSGYVVDADLKIMPRGGLGELVVEGPLVGRGYHGRPDLTEKVFLSWPEKACWAYRTGDLVRMLPDSTIEILGRIDTQIKLRGVRIESEGISAIVRKAVPKSQDVTLDATTILGKHPAIGSDQLVSFVTWTTTVPIAVRKSTRPTVATPPKGLMRSIRTVCNTELASYMRPSHVIPLSWLPLSSNGKTDAKILLDIFKQLSMQEITSLMTDGNGDSSTACNDTEEAIFSILKEHTHSYPGPSYPGLSVFECGLDSMAVIRFTSDLKMKFQKQLSASDVMKNPLLKDIARLVEVPSVANKQSSFEGLVPTSAIQDIYLAYPDDSVESVLPPFPIQQGVVSRSAELNSLYVQHVILQCQTGVSLSKLKQAWATIVSRHAMLRTVFYIDQLMLQVVLKPNNTPDVWSERRWDVPADRFAQAFDTKLAEIVTKDINNAISSIPPMRINAFSLPKANVIVLSLHHALYDGTSLPLIISDIENAYTGSKLLPVASTKEILAHISSNDSSAARQFWLKYFEDFRIPLSPFSSGWRDLSPESVHLSMQLATSLSVVKAAASKHRVTLQALLSYAFAKLVATRLYQSRDVSFGVIRSGRLMPVENIDLAICPTISLLPMRVNFDQRGSVLALMQEKISEMVDYENMPLAQVQGWVRPGENLFDILFSVSVRHHAKSILWTPLNDEPPPADYPLAVEAVMDPEEDSLTIRAGWLNGYLTEAFVADLLKAFEATALDTGALADAPITSESADVKESKIQSKVRQELTESPSPLDVSITDNLHRITSEFLGVKGDILTSSTSFISIGLDSIKAVGLAKRITKLGYKVNSTEVLRATTIEKLAHVIAAKTPNSNRRSTLRAQGTGHLFEATLKELRQKVDLNRLKLALNDEPAVFPATALQSGMLSQTIATSGALYVNTFPILLPNDMDMLRLRSVWRIALDMFSILRTSFHFIQEAGAWAQVVHSRCRLNWSLQDIHNDKGYTDGVQNMLNSLGWEDDNAFACPPVWLRLFTPSASSINTRPRLVLVMHHALYDGLSIPKLLYSIECLYRNKPLNAPVQFSALFPEIFQQEREGTSFWMNHLQGFRRTPLSVESCRGKVELYTTSKAIILDVQKVSSLLGAAGVTLQCLFQAGVAKLLSSMTHSDDIIFGNVVSGRSIPGSEDVIGPMLNTIPCRVRLGPSQTNLELLQQIHRSNLDGLPWQQASLRSIQKEMGLERLWDCLFTFQPAGGQAPSIWTLESSDEYGLQIQYALHIEVGHGTTSGFTLRAASRFEGFDHRPLSALINALGDFMLAIVDSINGAADRVAPEPVVHKKQIASVPTPPPPSIPTPIVRETVRQPILSNGSSTALVRDHRAPVSAQNIAIPPDLISILLAVVPGTEAVTFDTPMASLGVDSIAAIQIAGKCRLAGLLLRAADIINARTVGDIVTKLGSGGFQKQVPAEKNKTRSTISEKEYASIVARFGDNGKYVERILPMSPGLKFITAGWQSSHGSRWQTVFPFRLPNDIDTLRLKNAWKLLQKRHEILRSTFASAPRSPEPRVVTFSTDFASEHWFEETLDHVNFHQSLIDRLGHFCQNPLSIAQPAIRAVLFRSRPEAHVYFVIHSNHFLYDAWSFHLIVRALTALYNVTEPTTYCEIGRYLRSFPLQGSQLSSQEKYWKSVLPTPFQPTLFPRLHTGNTLVLPRFSPRICMGTASVVLQASDCDRKARSLGTSLNAVCLAVWASVHARYAGSSSASFGIWQAGRSGFIDDIESLVVPTLNVLPMHIPNAENVLETARYIREDLVARTPEIEQTDLTDIDQWSEAGGAYLFNTHVNIIKAPRMAKTDLFLEPVRGSYSIPEIAAATITPTLDEIGYMHTHRNDLMVEMAVLENTDSLYFAIDSDGSWMNREQTEKVLGDFVTAFTKVFIN